MCISGKGEEEEEEEKRKEKEERTKIILAGRQLLQTTICGVRQTTSMRCILCYVWYSSLNNELDVQSTVSSASI